jgi:glycerate kinase
MSDLTSQIAVLETQMKQVIKQVEEGFSNNSKQHEDMTVSNAKGHEEMMKAFREAVEKKADKELVDKLEANQNKVAWLIISTVILAVIGLVIIK